MSFKRLVDFSVYNNFVNEVEHSMLYHTVPYLKLVSEVLDCEIVIYVWEEGHQVKAACPWLVKEGIYGKIFNSLAYYGANGGILSINHDFKERLEFKMMKEIESESAGFAYISNLFSKNLLEDKECRNIERLAQISELPASNEEDKVMEPIHSKTRNMIRKGLKENLDFYPSQDSSFLELTHRQNMEAVGVKPKEAVFFNRLPKYFEFGKDYEIFEATIDGDKAAALLVFYHKDTVEYYMPAINVLFRNKQAMSALIFRVMQLSIAKKIKYWNWGGTPLSNENLYRFKSRFGGKDYPYTIQVKVNDKSLLMRTPKEIMAAYPGMFVVPFDMLSSD